MLFFGLLLQLFVLRLWWRNDFCSADVCKENSGESFRETSFPYYRNFDNSYIAHSDFITRLDCVTKAIAPFKTTGVKNNTIKWFYEEISEEINTLDKLYKNFKLLRLIDWYILIKEIHKEMGNAVQKLIRKKKNACFQEKVKRNTANTEKTLENS